MARYLSIGIDEFGELRARPNGMFVDKTAGRRVGD